MSAKFLLTNFHPINYGCFSGILNSGTASKTIDSSWHCKTKLFSLYIHAHGFLHKYSSTLL